MKTYVLFHHPCSDGMGAKYAAWKKFGDDATYLGVNYGKPMPAIEDQSRVYIIDFSYPRKEIEALHSRVSELVILDHHKTAQAELEGLPYAIFNMNKSGAVLAWEYFHPGIKVPTLLEIIQDRDLWKWKLPHSKPFLNFLATYGDDVQTWDKIAEPTEEQINIGKSIEKYKENLIDWSTESSRLAIKKINGNVVALLNATVLPSEIGARLYSNEAIDYSITYYIDNDGVVHCSLRSNGIFDVSEVAKTLGGGGHKAAAGARVDLQTLQQWIRGDNAA